MFSCEVHKELTNIVYSIRITTNYIDRVFFERFTNRANRALIHGSLPKITEEMSKTVKIANKHNIHMFTFGKGSTPLDLEIRQNSVVKSYGIIELFDRPLYYTNNFLLQKRENK